MGGFIDQYMPPEVPGYPCVSAPRTKTSIQVTAGGNERRNQEWEHPLFRFNLPEAPGREWKVIEGIKNHWMAMRGPFHSWPFTDPLDKASVALLKANEKDESVLLRITATDQLIGTGDGFTDKFGLVKTYTVGSETYTRRIHLPVLDTVKVGVAGAEQATGFTVTRPGGVVQFDAPPANGSQITAGFLFDVEVRFENDDVFEGIVRTYEVGGFAGLDLIEVRPC